MVEQMEMISERLTLSKHVHLGTATAGELMISSALELSWPLG